MKKSFITFEGLSSCGMGIQAFRLGEAIKTPYNGIFGGPHDDFFFTSEPRQDSMWGRELVRLIDRQNPDVATMTKDFISDRLHHSNQFRATRAAYHILCERYDLSTWAFQNVQGIDIQTLQDLHRYQDPRGCLQPDLTIYLTISPEEAVRRIELQRERLKAGGIPLSSRKSFENLDYQKRLEASYERAIDIAREMGREIIIVNGEQDRDKVAEEILEKVKESDLNRRLLRKVSLEGSSH